MPDNPTTEGSIVAYLRLDKSDWDRKLDEAEAKARELARVDPNVRVTTDTAKAIAELDAVREAEDRVAGTLVSKVIVSRQTVGGSNAFDATAALQAAQTDVLTAATAQADAAILQLALDQEADNEAMRQASVQALKESIMMEALAAAEHKAADAAVENAAAQDTAGTASKNAAESSARGMQAQTVAIAGAVALIGPLTAAVAGLGGAFLVEGAVGVAAVAGIKKEMQDGTVAGKDYSDGLAKLQADLAQIESTAAQGVLAGFESSVTTVNQAMPQLLAETHEFAGMLGQSGSNLVDGVITGLKVAKPLLEEGAGILQEWTGEFKNWVGNGGLKSFVEYAQEQLPRVAATLESLIKDAVMLGQDLTPIATDILDIADALEPLLTALNAGDKMLQGWGKAAPALKVVGDIIGDVVNPVQLLTHALQSGQGMIDQWTGATQLKTKATQDAAVAAIAQQQAEKNLASEYGMSAPELKAAQSAQKQNADQAAATTRELQLENDAASLLTNAFTLLNGKVLSVAQAQTGAAAATNTLLDSFKTNTTVIDGNSKAAVANQQALEQKVAADQQSAEAIAKQTGSTQAGTKAFADSKQALIDQLKAAGNLTPAIQALIDKYYAVPPVVKTKAEFDADAATASVLAFRKTLDQIDRNITVQVTSILNQSITNPNGMGLGSGINNKASGGAIYRAAGGPAYLAGGGDPWRPQGTDNVRAMLTEGEFVVREPSARQNPGFLKAYNADPARALAAMQRSGGGGVTVVISPKDGIDIRELIDVRVEQGTRRAMSGLALQMQGGATV